jgi:asparagine synthase (glutamine-hydrolysing)
VVPAAGPFRRARHFVDYVTGGLGAYLKAHDGLPTFSEVGLLGDRLLEPLPRTRQIPESISSARELLSDYLEHDLRHQFVGEYMTKVDGATMAQGLEARSPYLDHVLWEYASSLPFETRLHGRELKAVLRAIASRRVSARLATGAKRGFSVPVERWLRGRWFGEVARRLSEGPLCSDGWISRPGLQRALSGSALDGPGAHHLWYLAVLDSWLRHDAVSRVTAEATTVTPPLNAGG